jgi:hypothetical protein
VLRVCYPLLKSHPTYNPNYIYPVITGSIKALRDSHLIFAFSTSVSKITSKEMLDSSVNRLRLNGFQLPIRRCFQIEESLLGSKDMDCLLTTPRTTLGIRLTQQAFFNRKEAPDKNLNLACILSVPGTVRYLLPAECGH